MTEVWKPVLGYEGFFEVSNLGRVKSLSRYVNGKSGSQILKPERFLTPRDCHDGYLQVKFSVAQYAKQMLVHRLVAEAFIPNPNNLPQVNHKDGDKSNNTAENLEWCTAAYNSEHRSRVLNKWAGRPKKKVRCLDTGKIYESSHHASRDLGISQGGIFMVCQGKGMTAGGFRFEFIA